MVCSCETEALLLDSVREFNISSETQTRTVLEGTQVKWEIGDLVNVFGSTDSGCFKSVQSGVSASFQGNIGESSRYWALYPYDPSATCTEGVFKTSVPEVQKAVPGSFARSANVSVGVSSGTALTMLNVCSYVRFTTSQDYSKILISAPGCERLSGKAEISLSGTPSIKMLDESSASVTMVPQDGESVIPAGTYYAVIAPGFLTGGLRFSFFGADARIYEAQTAVSVPEMLRNVPVNAGIVDEEAAVVPARLGLSVASSTSIDPGLSSAVLYLDTNCPDVSVELNSASTITDVTLTRCGYDQFRIDFTPTAKHPLDLSKLILDLKSEYAATSQAVLTQIGPLLIDFSNLSAFSPAFVTASQTSAQSTSFSVGDKTFSIEYYLCYAQKGTKFLFKSGPGGYVAFPAIEGKALKEVIIKVPWHSSNKRIQAKVEDEEGTVVSPMWESGSAGAGYTSQDQFPFEHSWICTGTQTGKSYRLRGTVNCNCFLSSIKLIYE